MIADHMSLVRVTTDDRSHQLWAAAASAERALDLVLNAIPEGWCVRLADEAIEPWMQPVLSAMGPNEVRELIGGHPVSATATTTPRGRQERQHPSGQ